MSACDDYQPFKYYVNGDVDYYDSHPGDPVKTMYGVDIGGVCVYPKANCSADTIGNECCDLKGERKHGYSIATNLYNYGGIVLAVVIGRILNALRSQWIAAQRDKAARVVQDKASIAKALLRKKQTANLESLGRGTSRNSRSGRRLRCFSMLGAT